MSDFAFLSEFVLGVDRFLMMGWFFVDFLESDVSVDLEIRVGNNPVGLKNPLCAWQPGANLESGM